jgi:hypothetical protein
MAPRAIDCLACLALVDSAASHHVCSFSSILTTTANASSCAERGNSKFVAPLPVGISRRPEIWDPSDFRSHTCVGGGEYDTYPACIDSTRPIDPILACSNFPQQPTLSGTHVTCGASANCRTHPCDEGNEHGICDLSHFPLQCRPPPDCRVQTPATDISTRRRAAPGVEQNASLEGVATGASRQATAPTSPTLPES